MTRMTWMLAADGAGIDSSWIFIAVGVCVMIYFAFIKPAMRRKSDPLERAPAYASLTQQRATERQMQTLLVDLSEMARQISAQLDSRAAKLEILIAQADERLAALGGVAPASQRDLAPIMPLIEQRSESSDTPAPMLGKRSIDDESPPVPADSAPPPPVQEQMPDPRYADVYRLADQGREPPEIAAELHRPRGEVELILALRGR